jgi:hypothetical protein
MNYESPMQMTSILRMIMLQMILLIYQKDQTGSAKYGNSCHNVFYVAKLISRDKITP